MVHDNWDNILSLEAAKAEISNEVMKNKSGKKSNMRHHRLPSNSKVRIKPLETEFFSHKPHVRIGSKAISMDFELLCRNNRAKYEHDEHDKSSSHIIY